MKSKIVLLITVLLIIGLILTGCGFKIEPKVEDIGFGGGGFEEPAPDDGQEVALADNNQQNNSKISPILNQAINDDDIKFGFETRDVIVNGQAIKVQVDTFGSTKKQENGPYNIDYRVMINGKPIKEGVYHLESYEIDRFKNYNKDIDGETNNEFFESRFVAKTYRGEDKEYITILIPAGIDDKKATSLVLATDDGNILGDFNVDVIEDISISGLGSDRYIDTNGNVTLYSIEDEKITYLKPAESTDTSGLLIDLEEHIINISGNTVTDTKTENTYTLTNALEKELNFRDFNY